MPIVQALPPSIEIVEVAINLAFPHNEYGVLVALLQPPTLDGRQLAVLAGCRDTPLLALLVAPATADVPNLGPEYPTGFV